MKSSTMKLRKTWRKTNYTRQNKSLDSLGCVTMLYEMKDAG